MKEDKTNKKGSASIFMSTFAIKEEVDSSPSPSPSSDTQGTDEVIDWQMIM